MPRRKKAAPPQAQYTYKGRPVSPGSRATESARMIRLGWAASGGEPRRTRRQALGECHPGDLPRLETRLA